jgi:hypothetical protein
VAQRSKCEAVNQRGGCKDGGRKEGRKKLIKKSELIVMLFFSTSPWVFYGMDAVEFLFTDMWIWKTCKNSIMHTSCSKNGWQRL